MATIDSLFELGIELRDKGELRDSIQVFLKVLNDNPDDKAKHLVHSVLGGIHSDLREYDKALINFKTATDLKPKSELASLGLYLSYVELDRDEEAIEELKRYLRQFPADLYKDTLEELLGDIEEGYLPKFKDDIKELAKRNGVVFRDKWQRVDTLDITPFESDPTNINERNPTVANKRFAQLPGSVSSLSFGFIIYICHGDTLQLVSLVSRWGGFNKASYTGNCANTNFAIV